jgi:hypothetical protein
MAGWILAAGIICFSACKDKSPLVIDLHECKVDFPDLKTGDFFKKSPPEWIKQFRADCKAFKHRDSGLKIVTSYTSVPETIDSLGRIKFVDLLSDTYFHPKIPIRQLAVNVEVDSNSFTGQYYFHTIPDYPDHFGFHNLFQLDSHLVEVLIIKEKKEAELQDHWNWVNENKQLFSVTWPGVE